MPMTTLVVTSGPGDDGGITVDGGAVLSTLGPTETLGVPLNELIASVKQSIEDGLKADGHLTVEITGALSLQTCNGDTYGFLNIGGAPPSGSSMKIAFTSAVKAHSGKAA
jgi:hypothetical protein